MDSADFHLKHYQQIQREKEKENYGKDQSCMEQRSYEKCGLAKDEGIFHQ
jgi:hypothetical protein